MKVESKKAAPDVASIESSSGEKCALAGIKISVYDFNTVQRRTQGSSRFYRQPKRAGR